MRAGRKQRARSNTARAGAFLVIYLCSIGSLAAPPWAGYVDRSAQLQTSGFDFGGAGGNKNYYDGDFADYDGDGLPERCLGSRYGLLHNQGGGVMIPVSVQANQGNVGARPALVGFVFHPSFGIGEDAAQWADVDGDGDPDSIMGGNGEPLGIQVNRAGRFSLKSATGGWSALNIVNTDIEPDGDVDLAVAHAFCSDRSCGGPVDFQLLENDGSGRYTEVTNAMGLGSLATGTSYIVGVVSGDLDGDGDFDLAAFNGGQEEVTIAINDGGSYSLRAANFGRPKSDLFEIGSGFAQHMTLGDIDADGDLDLLIGLPENWDAGPLGSIGLHPNVSHVIFINDGAGNFAEESDTRFDVGAFAGVLTGNNCKLSDIDYDGDLDFIAYNKPGPIFLQLYLNDGTGHFTWRPDLVTAFTFSDAGELGTDEDITDLDDDGTYDLWVGSANQQVHTLINTYRDPIGVRADLPRDVRVEARARDAVTLSWQWPRWAAVNRHFKVYRSHARRMGSIDRERIAVIANSEHEDDSFAAPITAFTVSTGDPDVVIDGAARRVTWIDRTVVPGVTYHYSIAHVGTERTESRKTVEVQVDVPGDPPGPDTTPPELAIVSPTSEQWSQYPRIVLSFGDGGAGIDLGSLRVSFDQPVGGLPAGTDLSGLFQRKDPTSFVLALTEGQELPVNDIVNPLTTLTASIADVAGNVATRQIVFSVSVQSAQLPVASLVATLRPGTAIVDFDASTSSDPDWVLLRWEWYFGDGEMALGQQLEHRYRAPGTYDVTLVVRDNDGGVGSQTTTVAIASVDVDSDGDGALDPVDCAPDDPGAHDVPGAVLLYAARGAADEAILSWNDPSTLYGGSTVTDVASGSLRGLRSQGPSAAGCLEGSVTGTTTSDAAAVAVGEGQFYDVRYRNSCGAGAWGAAAPPVCP